MSFLENSVIEICIKVKISDMLEVDGAWYTLCATSDFPLYKATTELKEVYLAQLLPEVKESKSNSYFLLNHKKLC